MLFHLSSCHFYYCFHQFSYDPVCIITITFYFSFFLLSHHLHVPSTILHPHPSVHSPHPLPVHREPHTFRPSPASGWLSLWVCLIQEPLPPHLLPSLTISSHTMKCWTLPSPLLLPPPCWAALQPSLPTPPLQRSKRVTSFPSPPQSPTCPPIPARLLNPTSPPPHSLLRPPHPYLTQAPGLAVS